MNQQTSRVAISVSPKIDFQGENILRDKEDLTCPGGQSTDSVSELSPVKNFVLNK